MAEQKKKNNVKKGNNKQSSSNKKVVNNNNKTKTNSKNSTVKKKEEKVVVSLEKNEKKVETKEIKKEEPKKVKTEETVIPKKKEFKMTSMQKDLALVAVVVVLLIVALFVTSNKINRVNIELPVVLEGTPGFTEITYSEYENKMNEEKPFLVVIVRDGCGYCEQYEPIAEEVANEQRIPFYFINLSNITEDEFNKLSNSNSYLKREKWGTPTTLLLQGKNVIDSIGGYVEKDTLLSFIDKNIKVSE